MTEKNPFALLRSALDEIVAASILGAIEDAHKRKYLKICVNPRNYEPVRQAVCNVDPLMESAVLSRSSIPQGTAIVMDTSILERDWTCDGRRQ